MNKLYQVIARNVYELMDKNTLIPQRDKIIKRLVQIQDDLLPSGAGFDNGTTIIPAISPGNGFEIRTAYHELGEDGSYDGWRYYKIAITPDLCGTFNLDIDDVTEYDEIWEDWSGTEDYVAEHIGEILEREVYWDIDRKLYDFVRRCDKCNNVINNDWDTHECGSFKIPDGEVLYGEMEFFSNRNVVNFCVVHKITGIGRLEDGWDKKHDGYVNPEKWNGYILLPMNNTWIHIPKKEVQK